MLCRVRPDGRTLDNGCGTGRLLQKIKAENVVGLDISSEMLRRARSYSDALILGNSQELPFHDSSFDTVFCRSLLHHLPQPWKAVEEIARVLRPGGEVVFIDTNTSILSVLPRRIARGGDHFSHSHQNLSRRVFEGLLTPDFEIDEIMYFGYLAYPILGFPDLIDIFRFFPAKSAVERMLMTFDGLLSRIPCVRPQSWGILVNATKRHLNCNPLRGQEIPLTEGHLNHRALSSK
jgi:SAM-dependent methyltransferase